MLQEAPSLAYNPRILVRGLGKISGDPEYFARLNQRFHKLTSAGSPAADCSWLVLELLW